MTKCVSSTTFLCSTDARFNHDTSILVYGRYSNVYDDQTEMSKMENSAGGNNDLGIEKELFFIQKSFKQFLMTNALLII